VLWSGFAPHAWRYLDEPALRAFLLERVADGFSFPLNPKWVCVDPGWFEVFEALVGSEHSAHAWLRAAGLRERIEKIGKEYNDVFLGEQSSKAKEAEQALDEDSPLLDYELAELELKRFLTLQRAKQRVRALFKFRRPGVGEL